MTRGKGEGGLYKDARGLWTGVVELPPRDGKRRRKVVRSKDKRAALAALDAARSELAARGDILTANITVEQWFTIWLDTIAAKRVRPSTLRAYRSLVVMHIVPNLGPKTRLAKVTPAKVRAVHAAVLDKGLTSTYANGAHRVMNIAFNAALREGRVNANPVALTEAPRRNNEEQAALTAEQAIRLLDYIKTDPLGPVWATALLTGARRGEVLGITADRVSDVLDLSWQLQRILWSHGCDGTCDRKRGADCPRRLIIAPADYEHRQVEGGLYMTRPKSRRGWRIIPLVDPLRSILEWQIAHMVQNPEGLLFTTPDGRPLDPSKVSKTWKRVLAAAGIDDDVVLHGLRHTAVDLLLVAGVPEDVVQEIVGHSSRYMTRAYKTRGNRERLTAAMQSMSALVTLPGDGPATSA